MEKCSDCIVGNTIEESSLTGRLMSEWFFKDVCINHPSMVKKWINQRFKYCPICGHKIDWDKINEEVRRLHYSDSNQ